jgi:hypothetical protein
MRSPRKNFKIYNGQINRQRVRRLVFDSLEDRRLLAGLDVFVFEDTSNLPAAPSGNVPLEGQVVYLDQNNDSLFQSNEPWLSTNANGLARFEQLPLGEATPRLLGDNSSRIQTSPFGAAGFGRLIPVASSELVGWADDDQYWQFADSHLSLVDAETLLVEKTFGLPETLSSVAIHGDFAVGILGSPTNSELITIDLETGDTTRVPASQNRSWLALHVIDSQIFAQSASLIEGGNLVWIPPGQTSFPAAVPGSVIHENSEVFTNSESRQIAIVTNATADESTGNELALMQLDINARQISTIGQREFVSPIQTLTMRGDGQMIAIGIDSSVRVLATNATLNDVAHLSSATLPLAFDTARDVLFAVNNVGEIDAYSTSDWSTSYTFQPRVEAETPLGTSILAGLDSPDDRTIALATASGIYTHSVAVVVNRPISIRDERHGHVAIGLSTIGQNSRPTWTAPGVRTIAEDTSLSLDGDFLQSLVADLDADEVFFFAESGPTNGRLQMSPLGEIDYRPDENFEGVDTFRVRAFDGRDWSDPQVISVAVIGVNDAPSRIIADVLSVPENHLENFELGTISVIDPDSDAEYTLSVNDPRFITIGNRLFAAPNHPMDFESTPIIELPISAFDLHHPDDSITETITITVSDQNDAPTAIEIDSLNVDENAPGQMIGRVSVVDPDANDMHRWEISDDRFFVFQNELRLRDDVSLNYEHQSSIEITATVIDQNGAGDAIVRQWIVSVNDQDDPTVGIQMTESRILEKVQGFRIGDITVIDEDTDEIFDLTLSDSRFTVVDRVLRLKPNSMVDRAVDGDSLTVVATATSQATGKQTTQEFYFSIARNDAPWQNPRNPLDVDNDGQITPRDPLVIIHHINRNGIHPLDGSPDPEGEAGGDFIDVNGDGVVTAQDVLIVIHRLNGNQPTNSGEDGSGEGGSGTGGGEAPLGEGEGESWADSWIVTPADSGRDLSPKITPERRDRSPLKTPIDAGRSYRSRTGVSVTIVHRDAKISADPLAEHELSLAAFFAQLALQDLDGQDSKIGPRRQ